MGSEVLRVLTRNLKAAGVKALHLEVAANNGAANRIYRRAGFMPRDGYQMMTWRA